VERDRSFCGRRLPSPLQNVHLCRDFLMTSAPSRSRRVSPLRFLEPLAACVWILFLVWSAVVAAVWSLGIGEAEIIGWTTRWFHLPAIPVGGPKSPLQDALISFLSILDQGWVILAALNVYSLTAAREGLPTARKWGLLTIVAVGLVAWVSLQTKIWPLGPIFYTKLLGAWLLGVPYGLPLFWFAAIVGARGLMLQLQPNLPQLRLAFSTGALVLFLDFALEPVAWKLRVFWLWYGLSLSGAKWPPPQNYATWFLLGGALTFAMRESRLARPGSKSLRSPGGVFIVMFLILTAANVGRILHGGR
jgi:hypothetical protein